MAELSFECLGARAEKYAAGPTLSFQLRLTESSGAVVHAVALRVQIRIQPHARDYSDREGARVIDLFGERSRWKDTLKAIQFASVSRMVPGFTGATDIDLEVPCTYDLEVAHGRYFNALEEGEVPLLLLYSGTVFVKNGDSFSVEQLSWSSENSFRLPVSVWREMMDRSFPDSGWLRLHRDTLDAISEFKSMHALPTFDDAISALLAGARGVSTEIAGHD